MKLVTVLVPRAAPATVATASDTRACFARGSLLSLMKPACSQTPTSVPKVSNRSMNKKIRMKGIIRLESAPSRSIFSSVGAMLGGWDTTRSAMLNCY